MVKFVVSSSFSYGVYFAINQKKKKEQLKEIIEATIIWIIIEKIIHNVQNKYW